MDQPQPRNRTPVKRDKAEQYLLLMLISFAGSILLTRLFLELTGYPQLGNNELHIAHVLWGGLFLFAAVILPLTYANQWAVFSSAILGGIGFGLFIDEVGKFITQSNDYFFPLAAPIVYVIFLVTVFVYIRVRRRIKVSPRDELYRALQNITELLDNDLDIEERTALQSRLGGIIENANDSSTRELAISLLAFINSDKISVVPHGESGFFHYVEQVIIGVERILSQVRLRWLLIFGLGWIGVISAYDLFTLGRISYQLLTESAIPLLLVKGDTFFSSTPVWFTVRLGLQGIVGFLSLLAAIFYLIRKDKAATLVAILGLTVSLAAVDIIIFYLDQFSAAIGVLVELALFLGVLAYRRRFLTDPPVKPS